MSDLQAQLASADERFMSGDVEGGVREITELANGGYTPAQVILGWIFRTGASGVSVDPDAARRWWSVAAEQGDPVGLAYLGMTLLRDSPEEGVRCLLASGEKGYPPSFYELGRLYHAGIAVEPDFASATKYMRRAATLGHPRASAWIALMGVSGRYGTWGLFRALWYYASVPLRAIKSARNPHWFINLDHLCWPGPCKDPRRVLPKPPKVRPHGPVMPPMLK